MTPNSRREDQDTLDRESTLLPRDPPSLVIWGTAWLVIALFACGLIAAFVVRAPETISCPCILVPEGGADPIQSPRVAVIRQVLATEGREVAAGDRDTEARTLEEDLASRQKNIKQSELTDAADIQMKDHEIAQADDEVKFRESTLAVERDLAARVEKLQKIGVYSETDVIVRRLEVEGAEKDLSVTTRTRQEVILQRQQLAAEQVRQRSDQLAEVKKLEIRLGALKRQLEDSHQNMISIRAPYAGVVVSVAQNNPGSVVQNGQELCQLARANGKLRVRLSLTETGLARLAVGQRMRFFADAFPYQRYGTVRGTLSWISPSIVSSKDGQQFIATATLDQDAFQVGGQLKPLRVGMRGEARVVVGSRTLIEYALEPIRQLRENLGRP